LKDGIKLDCSDATDATPPKVVHRPGRNENERKKEMIHAAKKRKIERKKERGWMWVDGWGDLAEKWQHEQKQPEWIG